MNEVNVRRRIGRSLRRRGYVDITNTDAVKCGRCGNLYYPEKGRPDMLVLHPIGRSVVVEVKALKNVNCFPMNRISPEQRDWLSNKWLAIGGLGYIGMGIIMTHGEQERLDDLYLVEWSAWLELEARLEGILQCVPYDAERGRSKAVKEQQLDMKTAFARFRCTPISARVWEFPPEIGIVSHHDIVQEYFF